MSEIIEEWIDIIGYEGMYQISNLCRVKSMKFGKEKILKNGLNSAGYLFIYLCKEGIIKSFAVHQLVAQAFLGHVIDGHTMVVNHIDGNKLNNNINNLEIVPHRDNSSGKCFRKNQELYSSQYDNVCWNKSKNKWQSQIRYNGKHYHLGQFDTEKEASELSEIALSHINNGTFEEYFEKLRDNKYIKVLQYSKDGIFIREWNSATQGDKELNIFQPNICKCCKGKLKSAGGFIWKYKDM